MNPWLHYESITYLTVVLPGGYAANTNTIDTIDSIPTESMASITLSTK